MRIRRAYIVGVCAVDLTQLKLFYVSIFFQNLTVLTVRRNSIRQDLPNSIGELTNLSMLDLSYNLITSLPESESGCFKFDSLSLN